ncbi:MAG TPA: HAD-IIIC family phosphatase [Bryobacteraceae bacterium]
MSGFFAEELNYARLVRASKRLDPGAASATLKVALIGSTSTQHLVPLLRVLFHQQGINCDVYEGPFDAVELEVYDANSGLYRFEPDVIVLLEAVQALRTRFGQRAGKGEEFASQTIDQMTRVWEAIQARSRATILQSNFVLPYERTFGNFDAKVSESFSSVVRTLNQRMAFEARRYGSVLVNDVDFVASWAGRRHWFDDRLWDMAKMACVPDQLPYLAKNIVDIVLAQRGRVIKCVVLDLDNTLWGGVIGDDGVEGIKLNSHGDGEAFYRFQLFLRELLNRGILLCVCSKNELANALLPFEKHPDMILKREHITCFVANWQDKAQNIRQIRETLNIGFDSMVFLDDNPFERNVVRELAPGVVVPELPEDPADYVRAICELNLFETTAFSAEDVQRAEMYRLEAARREEQANYGSIEEFLQSLEMKMTLAPFDSYHLPRIAQLMQRSNQFNLTTQRRSEADCAALAKDARFLPLYATLADRLGDHGLISVVIVEHCGDEVAIRDWLMSCRVLKRGVEQTIMNAVFRHARELGATHVTGEYRPTAKNGMVKQFFAEFGFEKISDADGQTKWRMKVDDYQPASVFIEVNTAAPELAAS